MAACRVSWASQAHRQAGAAKAQRWSARLPVRACYPLSGCRHWAHCLLPRWSLPAHEDLSRSRPLQLGKHGTSLIETHAGMHLDAGAGLQATLLPANLIAMLRSSPGGGGPCCMCWLPTSEHRGCDGSLSVPWGSSWWRPSAGAALCSSEVLLLCEAVSCSGPAACACRHTYCHQVPPCCTVWFVD